MEEKQIKIKLKIQIMLDRLVRTITNIMIYLRGNKGAEVLFKMIMAEKNSRKIKRYKKAQQTLRRLTCLKKSFPRPCLPKPIVRLPANLLPLFTFCLDFQIHFLASSCFMTCYGTKNHRDWK